MGFVEGDGRLLAKFVEFREHGTANIDFVEGYGR